MLFQDVCCQLGILKNSFSAFQFKNSVYGTALAYIGHQRPLPVCQDDIPPAVLAADADFLI